MLTKNQIRELQLKLIALGIPLSQFGADGQFGDETENALATYAATRNLQNLTREQLIEAIFQEDDLCLDLTEAHTGLQWRLRQPRPWNQITGFTLHQTAVLMGEDPRRWYSLHAHLGITRAGRALLICPLTRIVWHGNGFNPTDVGIEIDGYFEGVEGQRETLWNPPTDPQRRPLTPTQEQIEATRNTIRWLCATVKQNGGNIQFIHAHRQGHAMRRSDPGSLIWREVGVWAQRELGLSDGGRKFTLGTGLPIPEAWDRSRKGVAY